MPARGVAQSTAARGPAATIRPAGRAWDKVRAPNDRMKRSCRTFIDIEQEADMTAFLIALALASLVAIAVWEAFQ